MGKHPAPIFQHPIIRIINNSHLWSSFDPRARYKQLWGFAEPGAQQSPAYPSSYHHSSTNPKKISGIFIPNFYLVSTWVITSSTPKKSTVQQLWKMTGHIPNFRSRGWGGVVWIWVFFSSFHGISRAGAEPGIPHPLLQNPPWE